VSLYEDLLALRPSIGAQVSLACALANARGPEAGLQALDAIPADEVTSYQPFWAARAHLLAAGGTRAPACGRRRARGRPAGLRPCDRAEHQRGGADVSGREVAAALSRRGVVNAH
jgi:RNA polymerase sigma-70 factor (ECF subfamily)